MKDHMENMTTTNDVNTPAETEHPAIRVHPVTGKKAHWVNPVYTIRFKGYDRGREQTDAGLPEQSCR